MSAIESNSADLAEEIEALGAIYGDDFTVDEYGRYSIQFEQGLGSILFWFSELYPAQAPPRYRVELGKGISWKTKASSAEVDAHLQSLWESAGGGVIVYEWAEYLRQNLETFVSVPQSNSTVNPADSTTSMSVPTTAQFNITIHHGEIFVDRKSRFQAHVAHVTSLEQVQWVVQELLQDGKIQTATHNMVAFRLRQGGHENRDDDGEGGAGDRMLYLLQKMNVNDIVGVVTRWYGGIPLGPDRFKDITGVLKQLVEQHVQEFI